MGTFNNIESCGIPEIITGVSDKPAWANVEESRVRELLTNWGYGQSVVDAFVRLSSPDIQFLYRVPLKFIDMLNTSNVPFLEIETVWLGFGEELDINHPYTCGCETVQWIQGKGVQGNESQTIRMEQFPSGEKSSFAAQYDNVSVPGAYDGSLSRIEGRVPNLVRGLPQGELSVLFYDDFTPTLVGDALPQYTTNGPHSNIAALLKGINNGTIDPQDITPLQVKYKPAA